MSLATIGVEGLGFEPDQQKQLLHAIGRPYGMILATGPTGSGKTISLYTCLNLLNQPGVNISTAEDPAEIQMPGINQVNINEKAGLTFATALRAFLRQDPDVIMVGEIRDLETADMEVQAALTGHLVFSTLHTNDACSSVARLVELGVPSYLVNATLIGVLAQRLVRTLCPHCKQPAEPIGEPVWKELVAPWRAPVPARSYKPVGCLECRRTGYLGRIGLIELLKISDPMRKLIGDGAEIPAMRSLAAREGLRSLRVSGAEKIAQGLTTLEEVLKAAPPGES